MVSVLLSAGPREASAQGATGWTGKDIDGQWSRGGNWDNGAPNDNGANSIRDLYFGQGWKNNGGSGFTTANNTLTNYSGYRITFQDIGNNGPAADDQTFTLTGNAITLFDFGSGKYPRIENGSYVVQNVNMAVTFNDGTNRKGEINPVFGDLSMGSTVDLASTTDLQIFGNNGKTVTFTGAISSSGNLGNNKLILQQNSTIVFKGANTYAGETDINAGSIRVDAAPAGAGVNSTYYVGNGGAAGTAATLLLGGGASGINGGVTFSNPVIENTGSGGNRVIGGTNTSGINAFGGTVTITDGNATFRAATGGTVTFNTVTSSAANTVAIGGASNNGTVSFTGSANNANIGVVVNSGTLLLAKTNSSTTVHAINGGITVNNGGTVLLGGTGGDQVMNGAAITLNGGTFGRSSTAGNEGAGASRTGTIGNTNVITGASSFGLGALTLSATSTIDFGDGTKGTLTFGGLSFTTTGLTLNVLNYDAGPTTLGTTVSDGNYDRLIFAQDQNSNLSRIFFNGVGAQQITLDSGYYEIVPVPEPTTWLAGMLALGTLGWSQRRRVRGWVAGARRHRTLPLAA